MTKNTHSWGFWGFINDSDRSCRAFFRRIVQSSGKTEGFETDIPCRNAQSEMKCDLTQLGMIFLLDTFSHNYSSKVLLYNGQVFRPKLTVVS